MPAAKEDIGPTYSLHFSDSRNSKQPPRDVSGKADTLPGNKKVGVGGTFCGLVSCRDRPCNDHTMPASSGPWPTCDQNAPHSRRSIASTLGVL